MPLIRECAWTLNNQGCHKIWLACAGSTGPSINVRHKKDNLADRKQLARVLVVLMEGVLTFCPFSAKDHMQHLSLQQDRAA